jgi:hypothetical protein
MYSTFYHVWVSVLYLCFISSIDDKSAIQRKAFYEDILAIDDQS